MAAPIVVVLDRRFAEDVCWHLHGDVYLDGDVDQLLNAMRAAAVAKSEAVRDAQGDLFGGRS